MHVVICYWITFSTKYTSFSFLMGVFLVYYNIFLDNFYKVYYIKYFINNNKFIIYIIIKLFQLIHYIQYLFI
jgi:hypothetical protein